MEELEVIGDCRKLWFELQPFLFKEYKYTLNPQMIKACISIGSNIVEGRRRGTKEFIRFIDIAIGSADELKYQLSLG
jgi:four helix bundle protein